MSRKFFMLSLCSLLLLSTKAWSQDQDPTFNGLFKQLRCTKNDIVFACNVDYCVATPLQEGATGPYGVAPGFTLNLEQKYLWHPEFEQEGPRIGPAGPAPPNTHIPILFMSRQQNSTYHRWLTIHLLTEMEKITAHCYSFQVLKYNRQLLLVITRTMASYIL